MTILYALVVTALRVLFVWAPREIVRLIREIREYGWSGRPR